jgi:hypothetical protein
MPERALGEATSLLDELSAADYLRERGQLDDGPVAVTTLTGGVSNVVLLVEQAGRRVVLKQALERLKVADDWTATPTRAHTEATALRFVAKLTPDAVPAVLDDDEVRHTLLIEAAPRSWRTWKDQLIAGQADAGIARWLGVTLRRWHEQTWDGGLPAPLEDLDGFRQLRVQPFFGVAARRRPDLGPALTDAADAMAERRRCLVMGDFSPKNVLVGDDGGWVIDFEVAHRGDPAFDVAFLACHLLLKSVHLAEHAEVVRSCLTAFLDAYGDSMGAADGPHLCRLIGSLLLARVVGSSPASYLRPAEAAAIELAAARILREAPTSIDDVYGVVAAS